MATDDARETGHQSAASLGTGSARQDVDLILEAHAAVLPVVIGQADAVARAVSAVVDALSTGRRLLYVGAGTSGWLAALDAAEVVTTFGMAGRVDSIVGGGLTLDPVSMTLGDDDVPAVDADERISACTAGDVVIAVSASGRTPFTLAAVVRMRERGATVIAIVNDQDTPLAEQADIVVCFPSRGEVVTGSTRLTAGMAQKVVLNTISTASMVRFGRTVSGQMVCVVPLNDKLRARIVTAIANATGVSEDEAATVLTAAGQGDVAVVSLLAGVDVDEARRRLAHSYGSIHRATVVPWVE